MKITYYFAALMLLFCTACSKNDKLFLLKQLQLTHYEGADAAADSLYLQLFQSGSNTAVLTTETYPSTQTLPAVYAVHPALPLPLYQQNYRVELWGKKQGYIGSCEFDMDHYKIIFPLEIEAESETIVVSLKGGWK